VSIGLIDFIQIRFLWFDPDGRSPWSLGQFGLKMGIMDFEKADSVPYWGNFPTYVGGIMKGADYNGFWGA